jgi:hypothetical protein
VFQKYCDFTHPAHHKLFLTVYNSVAIIFTMIRLRTDRSRNLDFHSAERVIFFFTALETASEKHIASYKMATEGLCG